MKKHHAANRADPPCFQVQCISFSVNCNDYSPIQSFLRNYFRKMKQQKQKKATELAGIKQRKSKHWMENIRASRVGPRNVNMLKRLIWFKKCKTSNCFKDCYLQGWKHLQGSCLKVFISPNSSSSASKLCPVPSNFTAGLITFAEEILNGKLHFLCSVECGLVNICLQIFPLKTIFFT